MYYNKYKAKPVVIDNIRFASTLEGKYYQELLFLKKAGVVKDIKLQPRFLLQEKFKKDGKLCRPIFYVADFQVKYKDGHTEIVELKGMETQLWRVKQKLFEHKYPKLHIKIVK